MKKAVFFVFVLLLLTTSVYAFSIKDTLTGFSINNFIYNLFHRDVVGINSNPYEGEPNLVVSPQTIWFGNTTIANINLPTIPPNTKEVTIINNGDANLIINNIEVDDNLIVSETSFTVPPLSSHNINFTFMPTSVGNYNGIIQIFSNDPDNPTSINYYGIGLESSPFIVISSFLSNLYLYYLSIPYGNVYPNYGYIPFQITVPLLILGEVWCGDFNHFYSPYFGLDGRSIRVLVNNETLNMIPLSQGQYYNTVNLNYTIDGLLYTKFQLINSEGEIISDTEEEPIFAAVDFSDPKYDPDNEINIEGGYLILDGQRFFPIGTVGGANLDLLVEAKMNSLWYWNMNSITFLNILPFLSTNNIKLFFGSKNSFYSGGEIPIYQEYDFFLGLVSDVNFKSMIGWSNRDEPVWGGYSIESIEEAYNSIRGNDSDRIIWMNFAPAHSSDNLQQYIEDVRAYSQYADVISVDIYPIWDTCFDNPPVCGCDEGVPSWDPYCILNNPYISVIGDFVDLYKQQIIQDDDKPFWIILQASPNEQLIPTYEQIRFMTYQSIIHGATGVFYFNPTQWENLKKVTQEISDLSNIITTDYSYRAINTADGIEYLEILYSNFSYVIAVNRNDQTVQKYFDTDYRNSIVNVLYENRQLNTNPTGIFSDTFEPFDTHVYKIPIQSYLQFILTANPVSGYVPLTVNFNLQGDFPINAQFRWHFGNQIVINSLTSMQYTFSNMGNYNCYVEILQNGQVYGTSNFVTVIANPQTRSVIINNGQNS